ncbi:MAG: hypothetical protein GY755_08630, partial [Chloroflexi bacterium]|nr:hypothetical protein [Chloroflexota bacterium]
MMSDESEFFYYNNSEKKSNNISNTLSLPNLICAKNFNRIPNYSLSPNATTLSILTQMTPSSIKIENFNKVEYCPYCLRNPTTHPGNKFIHSAKGCKRKSNEILFLSEHEPPPKKKDDDDDCDENSGGRGGFGLRDASGFGHVNIHQSSSGNRSGQGHTHNYNSSSAYKDNYSNSFNESICESTTGYEYNQQQCLQNMKNDIDCKAFSEFDDDIPFIRARLQEDYSTNLWNANVNSNEYISKFEILNNEHKMDEDSIPSDDEDDAISDDDYIPITTAPDESENISPALIEHKLSEILLSLCSKYGIIKDISNRIEFKDLISLVMLFAQKYPKKGIKMPNYKYIVRITVPQQKANVTTGVLECLRDDGKCQLFLDETTKASIGMIYCINLM